MISVYYVRNTFLEFEVIIGLPTIIRVVFIRLTLSNSTLNITTCCVSILVDFVNVTWSVPTRSPGTIIGFV
jgi:hypothetical protein